MTKTKTVVLALMLSGCAFATASTPTPMEWVFSHRVFGIAAAKPTATHQGIWDDTAMCLTEIGMNFVYFDLSRVHVAVVDSMISAEGHLSYGLTWYHVATNSIGMVFESAVWWNASVWSHESIHALLGEWDHEGPEWACEMPSAVELPYRPRPLQNPATSPAP